MDENTVENTDMFSVDWHIFLFTLLWLYYYVIFFIHS